MPSEFNLIQQYFTRPTPQADLGVGDDAALVRVAAGMQLAISSDMLVADTHFFAEAAAYDIGWKALAAGDILVHRQSASTFKKLISSAAGSLSSGNCLVAFPEGTRSSTGKLGALKRGPFLMAQKAGVKVKNFLCNSCVSTARLDFIANPTDAHFMIWTCDVCRWFLSVLQV